MKRRYTTTDGQVISLMCARFEDALAEGRADAVVTEHASECVRCHMLLKQIDGEQGAIASIATASGPVSLPSGFTEGVLARALPPERYLKNDEPVPAPRFKWWHHAITGLVAGVCTALLIWAGGDAQDMIQSEQAKDTIQATALEVADDDQPLFGDYDSSQSDRNSAMAQEELSDFFKNVARVLPAASVPEHAIDLPNDLRLAILRQIKKSGSCPKSMKKPVRITLTVGKKGAFSNRTVYSVASQTSAHDCVNQALDALTLPPMGHAANVTLDIAW
jgi:hypothetical protein